MLIGIGVASRDVNILLWQIISAFGLVNGSFPSARRELFVVFGTVIQTGICCSADVL